MIKFKVLTRRVLCAVCYIRQSENYYTKTDVRLLKLQKGHSQCMLGS